MATSIITQFVLKQFAKKSARKTGVAQLLKANDPIVQSNVRNIEIILKDMGINTKNLTSTDDVLNAMNYRNAMMDQHIKQQFKGLNLDKGIKSLEKKDPFQGFTPRVQQDVDSIIKNLKSMEPTVAMKEANLVIGRKGNYKHLSGDEAQRILKETDDHIFQRDIKPDPEDMASGGIAGQLHLNRPGYFLGDLVKEKIPAEYRLYAKSILPGGESGKVGSDYFTGDFKQELRKQALDKYKRTGKLRGTVGEVDQHRGDPTINKLIGFPSTYASLGTYTYDIDPKTLDVKITDRYDWNPAYGKQKIADTEVIGWIGDKKGKDVDLPMLKDFAVSAVKEGWSPSSALELIGNYFGGKASEGKGFDVDIDIPTRKATSATEGSFAKGGLAHVLGV